MKRLVDWTIQRARKVIVGVIGFTVIGIGVAMIFLPGPAVVVIPAGLAILATEFIWARSLLQRVRDQINRMRKNQNNNTSPPPPGNES